MNNTIFCIASQGKEKFLENQNNYLSISVHWSFDSNREKVEQFNLIFSRNLIGRKILIKEKFFLADFDNTTTVNGIFLPSVFIDLSIPMRKKIEKLSFIFLEIWLVEKFWEKNNFSRGFRQYNRGQYNFISISVHWSLDSNEKKVE